MRVFFPDFGRAFLLMVRTVFPAQVEEMAEILLLIHLIEVEQ